MVFLVVLVGPSCSESVLDAKIQFHGAIGYQSAGAGLHVELDRSSPIPIHAQLEVGLRDAIRAGRLPADSVVPADAAPRRPVRHLARRRRRGVPAAHRGGVPGQPHRRVHPGRQGHRHAARRSRTVTRRMAARLPAATHRLPLRPARTSRSSRARPGCGHSARCSPTAPNDRLNYLDGRGAPELRAGARRVPQPRARHLGRPRPDHRVQRLRAGGDADLPGARLARGITRLAVEDPSDADARREAINAGMELIPIPVTPTGIDTDALAASTRAGGAGDAGAPVPGRERALPRAPHRARRVGQRHRRDHHRGRLRRRVPLRLDAGRIAARARAGARHLRRHREQDARARAPARLDDRARSQLAERDRRRARSRSTADRR